MMSLKGISLHDDFIPQEAEYLAFGVKSKKKMFVGVKTFTMHLGPQTDPVQCNAV